MPKRDRTVTQTQWLEGPSRAVGHPLWLPDATSLLLCVNHARPAGRAAAALPEESQEVVRSGGHVSRSGGQESAKGDVLNAASSRCETDRGPIKLKGGDWVGSGLPTGAAGVCRRHGAASGRVPAGVVGLGPGGRAAEADRAGPWQLRAAADGAAAPRHPAQGADHGQRHRDRGPAGRVRAVPGRRAAIRRRVLRHCSLLPPGLGELAHLAAAVGVEIVPDENDRGVQGSVRGGDQGGVVGLGHAGTVALAAAVDMDAVEEPARPAGLQAGHARDRQAAGVAGDPGHGRAAAARPGAGLPRPQRLPGLVLEADPAPVSAASLVPWPRSPPATPRSRHRLARRPGGPGPGASSRGGAAGTTSPAACRRPRTGGRPATPRGPGSSAGPGPSRARPGPPPALRAAARAGPRRAGTGSHRAPWRRGPPARRPARRGATSTPTSC